MEHREDRRTVHAIVAAVLVVGVVCVVYAGIPPQFYGHTSNLDVVRTSAEYVVPEAGETVDRFDDDMADFDKSVQATVETDTSSQKATQLKSKITAEKTVAMSPRTQEGVSAKSAAKNAVSDLKEFESARKKIGAAPLQEANGIVKVGDFVETGMKTQNIEEHSAPSSIEVHHAEKSAARASSNAVDDLSNFEKAVSSTKPKIPVIVKQAPLINPQRVIAPGMSQQEWGKKELYLATTALDWLDPDTKGGKCDKEFERQQCGQLACNGNSTCEYCHTDADCHSPRYRCWGEGRKPCGGERGCHCHHKTLFPMVSADLEAMALAFMATALAASGGIGGGGLLVPLFILVEDFEADLASPLSSATITGGAIVGYYLYAFRWHPLYPAVQRPLIDYETVLIILPSLLTGTMIGTIFDKILPLWFIMTMLFLLLGFSTVRTCQKGIQELESEAEGNSEVKEPVLDSPADSPLLDDKEITGTRFPIHTLSLIGLFWIFVFLIALLKGGSLTTPSILPFVKCNNEAYWILQIFCWMAMFIAFFFIRDQVLHHRESVDGDIIWTPTNSITLPMICLPCGIAAGLLGVGGGMVVGPLLLELGARKFTVAATSTFTILVTASSSAVQFVLMGKLPPFYALFFAIIGGCGTLVGQLAVERIIKKFNSTSIIVFGISAVICGSTIAMGFTGMRSIIRIAEVGGNMGLRNLCA